MITKIIPLGDLHAGRQTRLIETDTSRYIEKPRDNKTEAAFSQFCNGFAKLGVGTFSRSPNAITIGADCHTQEIVENLPTTSEGGKLYWHRAGILTFVCYLFASADLHCENIIASGDMPVLIDLETLLTGCPARQSSVYNLTRSVMCTHLLCNFAGEDGKLVDVSGFSGVTSDLKNIPYTKHGRVFLWQEQAAFTEGFLCAYRTAMAYKPEVERLLHLFDDCTFRQILRPTQTYHTLSRYIDSLASDKREAAAWELLSRAYKRDIDKNRLTKAEKVLREEVRSVCIGEIPLFHTAGNGTSLISGGHTMLEGHLGLSPVSYAIKRLSELSDKDLARQKKIIELAISASTPIEKEKHIFINIGASAAGEIAAKAVSESAVPHLPSVFCELTADAKGITAFTSVGVSLYSGLIGVLCMYAALYRKTDNRTYRDTLMRHYKRFVDLMLKDHNAIRLTNENVSLGDGITGILAGLLHISELIGDAHFKTDAQTLIDRLVLSESLDNADYLNGAGALPVILAKCETDKNPSIYNYLADTLSDAKPYTTGTAHGAAGFLLTFSTIYAKNSNKTIAKAIHSVIQWEESKYSAADGNWYDLRNSSHIGFMSGWCSGAPGIGMARDAVKRITTDPVILAACTRDIDRAKTFLALETPCRRDSLCCGTAARLMAASRLGVRVDALYASLAKAEKDGSLRFFHPAGTKDINVSLMQGLSGVAYALAMYGDPLSGGMLL